MAATLSKIRILESNFYLATGTPVLIAKYLLMCFYRHLGWLHELFQMLIKVLIRLFLDSQMTQHIWPSHRSEGPYPRIVYNDEHSHIILKIVTVFDFQINL